MQKTQLFVKKYEFFYQKLVIFIKIWPFLQLYIFSMLAIKPCPVRKQLLETGKFNSSETEIYASALISK